MHVHFIGIGGVGMSGLAQIVLARGDRVTGSDPSENAATERLAAAGAVIYRRQAAENVAAKPDLVVVTAAVREDNPELIAARAGGIPVVSRAEFLGNVMTQSRGPRIAIAGTHGKTTTTAMAAEVLLAAGLDPTVLVGGEYTPIGGNVRVGSGGVFLTEACEAYDSFLELHPDITVITNVEADHLDHYGTEERVFDAFEQFARQTAHTGCLIYCADNWGARQVARVVGESAGVRTIGYGLDRRCGDGPWADQVGCSGTTTRFTLRLGSAHVGPIQICAPGRHNVLNALAAAAVGLEAGATPQQIAKGLAAFVGTGRRFQVLGETLGVTVVDDYAHHPTEIRATIAAARAAYPGRRLVVAFQPHLYSRTRDFMDGFVQSLGDADVVVLTEIYAAREAPIAGVDASEIARRLAGGASGKPAVYIPSLDDVADALRRLACPGDVVLTMGAGSIGEAAVRFMEGGSLGHAQRP